MKGMGTLIDTDHVIMRIKIELLICLIFLLSIAASSISLFHCSLQVSLAVETSQGSKEDTLARDILE